MLSRRTFIKTTAAATLASLVLPSNLLAGPTNKDIGIQLYTIRDYVNDDLPGTLATLKKIGYGTVEAAGYGDGKFYGMSPKEFRKLVIDSGLKPISSHCSVNPKNAQQVCDDHLEAGASYVVVPSMAKEYRENLDGYKTIAEDFNKIGEICNKSDLAFGYHNHAFEFEKLDNEIPYDVLLHNTDADLVFYQLDTYWMVYGGYSPVDYFKQFPGRFELLHVKDMDETSDRKSTEIGNGFIDFRKILKSRKSGMEYIFVEQEEFAIDPIESITASFNYLNSLKY